MKFEITKFDDMKLLIIEHKKEYKKKMIYNLIFFKINLLNKNDQLILVKQHIIMYLSKFDVCQIYSRNYIF
jgi:hypothetical protein